MNEQFLELFFVFMLFGFVMGGAYLWLMLQVWKSGARFRFFSLSHDAFLFSKYRELVKAGSMPFWPLYLYWAAMIGAAVTALGLMATFNK